MNENLKATIRNFEDYLYSKMAPITVKETVRKIVFLGKKTDITSRDSILDLLRDERRDGLSKKTINEHIKILNRWLEYKKQEKILYLKVKRSFIVKYYDQDQIHNLLTKSKGTTVEDRRDHTMLLLALNTGLRRAEISNLKLEDIHEKSLTVTMGKGEKARTVYLDPTTRDALREYSRFRNNQSSTYLFTTRTSHMTPEYMGKISRRITKRTGVELSWHKCRHTYAKNLLRNDIDLETIRQMLGHENLGTTQIYAVLDSGEALERIEKKKLKFFTESKRYKSDQPCLLSNGLEGT